MSLLLLVVLLRLVGPQVAMAAGSDPLTLAVAQSLVESLVSSLAGAAVVLSLIALAVGVGLLFLERSRRTSPAPAGGAGAGGGGGYGLTHSPGPGRRGVGRRCWARTGGASRAGCGRRPRWPPRAAGRCCPRSGR